MSHDNDSNYTFEFGQGQGGDVENNGHNISSKFKRGMRSHADVKRDLKLPAINVAQKDSSTKPNQSLKSVSGGTNSSLYKKADSMTRHTSIRSLPSMAKSVASVELGGGDDDLGKLIALRSLSTEIQQFLVTCKNSLHKRPWNKVHQRYRISLHFKKLIPFYPCFTFVDNKKSWCSHVDE